MSYTFDGINKVITLNTGVVAMSVRDVYSRWVDWFISDEGNQKFLPAFLTVGGDIIDAAAGTSIPIYAFLTNGWRIRPQEANHTLTVTDGILLVSGGGDPFLNTIGDFIVRVNYQQPVQAITVNTAGGSGGPSYTLDQIADAVWSRANRSLTDGDIITNTLKKHIYNATQI
jgi:hypothetical protein